MAILYKKGLNMKAKNNIISMNLSQSNNCCLFFQSKDLVCIKSL